MINKLITAKAIEKREYWVKYISESTGDFSKNSNSLEDKLSEEIKNEGSNTIIEHLRLCGNIPEYYGHDSTEEKLYSKYTDSLLSQAYKEIGLRSSVLKERADVADVEVFARKFNFVADAKAFRLSRTAKNQKDFKVQAMDRWKYGKSYAMVVCPIYQLPSKSSQIYEQATSRNVCIYTYSHLAMLVRFSEIKGKEKAEELMEEVFKSISLINPSKSAFDYWKAINGTMLNYSDVMAGLWDIEKRAAIESIDIGRKEALTFLAREREKIMRMNHDEALKELIKIHKIESKITMIKSVCNNNILSVC